MSLIKTSFLNAIAVAIKMLTLLGVNKVLALYVGPAGYAAIGQFQNAVQMITTFASGAINTGVTKYTAEFHSDEPLQRRLWKTAGSIVFLGTLVTAAIIFAFSKKLAFVFLNDESYSGVFVWFSMTLIFFTMNSLLLAILNGKKEIFLYVLANIAGSIFSLVVTAILSIRFGLYGALVSLAIYHALSFFVTFFICQRTDWFRIGYLFWGVHKQTALDLLKFTLMSLTSAVCIPLSHMFVRNHLGQNFGWDAAGYWEAMWRLSAAYLMLVTTTLGLYYLPRLSELKTYSSIRDEVLLGYKLILPLAVVCSISIYFFRDFIIIFLFTEKFLPMRELFAWQMLGDTLKIGSWILAFLMWGKAMFKLFIFTEIIFSLGFTILSTLLTKEFGLVGVAIAYALNYTIYWIISGFLVLRNLSKTLPSA